MAHASASERIKALFADIDWVVADRPTKVPLSKRKRALPDEVRELRLRLPLLESGEVTGERIIARDAGDFTVGAVLSTVYEFYRSTLSPDEVQRLLHYWEGHRAEARPADEVIDTALGLAQNDAFQLTCNYSGEQVTRLLQAMDLPTDGSELARVGRAAHATVQPAGMEATMLPDKRREVFGDLDPGTSMQFVCSWPSERVWKAAAAIGAEGSVLGAAWAALAKHFDEGGDVPAAASAGESQPCARSKLLNAHFIFCGLRPEVGAGDEHVVVVTAELEG